MNRVIIIVSTAILFFLTYTSCKKIETDTSNNNFNPKEKPFRPKHYIKNYIGSFQHNDFVKLEAFYADTLKRYYERYNLTEAEVINKRKRIGQLYNWTEVYWTDWESIKTQYEADKILLSFDYDYERKDNDKDETIRLPHICYMELNTDMEITSVYMDIREKSVDDKNN